MTGTAPSFIRINPKVKTATPAASSSRRRKVRQARRRPCPRTAPGRGSSDGGELFTERLSVVGRQIAGEVLAQVGRRAALDRCSPLQQARRGLQASAYDQSGVERSLRLPRVAPGSPNAQGHRQAPAASSDPGRDRGPSTRRRRPVGVALPGEGPSARPRGPPAQSEDLRSGSQVAAARQSPWLRRTAQVSPDPPWVG